MSASALSAEVHLSLDRFALDVNIETRAHVTGLFGASGSGKTSFLEAVAGIRRAEGRIQFGQDVWLNTEAGIRRGPEARSVGYVPQDGLLFPHLSVKKNLLAGARRARLHGHDVESTLEHVSSTLGLEPLWHRSVGMLSGGERQRVALGRALCSSPRLLLLDEPFASLDVPLRRRLLPFLQEVRQKFATPIVMVSHDPSEVQAICDEVIVLEHGRVTARGAPRQVLAEQAGESGFDNVLPCRVVDMAEDEGRVELVDGTALATRPARANVGDRTFVSIGARDVIVATTQPHALSARNILSATIERRQESRAGYLLEMRLQSEALTVEVSGTSYEELSLAEGKSVHLIIKSSSCDLYLTESDLSAALK